MPLHGRATSPAKSPSRAPPARSPDVDYLGQTIDPWDNQRAVFSASATINRDDWGVGWNMVLDAGGLLVSKEIRLEIEVELVRQHPSPPRPR